MTFKSLFLTLFVSTLSLTAFAADCYGPEDEVTLSGVLTTKATYIDPSDFGWAPKNGFQAYDALVVQTPVCFEDKENGVEAVKDIYVLQTGGVKLSEKQAEKMPDGIKVKLKGKLMPEETAHHFQKLVFLVTETSVEK
ncbi:MAG TPA: hypothetical protein VM901_03120 [Bdellovibrionota bacterium]|nr:hypothetical protein [Bdellovibrionota bacterium]